MNPMSQSPSFAPFTLHTERLALRFIGAADSAALFPIFADPEAMRYWSSAPWQQPGQAEASVAETLDDYASGARLRLGVALRATGELIGTCTLYAFDRPNRRCDVGYMLNRAHWGRGYMPEAMAAVIGHAFGALGLNRIEADIDPRNTASARLLERLHFVHEGHMRERWLVNGEICDSDFFGLLRSDWLAAGH